MEEPEKLERRKALQWDGTINTGTVITLLVVVLPVLWATFTLVAKVDHWGAYTERIESKVDSQGRDIKAIQIEMVKKEVLGERLAELQRLYGDHESRIRELEGTR